MSLWFILKVLVKNNTTSANEGIEVFEAINGAASFGSATLSSKQITITGYLWEMWWWREYYLVLLFIAFNGYVE